MFLKGGEHTCWEPHVHIPSTTTPADAILKHRRDDCPARSEDVPEDVPNQQNKRSFTNDTSMDVALRTTETDGVGSRCKFYQQQAYQARGCKEVYQPRSVCHGRPWSTSDRLVLR